ncbi:MAG: Imm61 family immunity protein [Microbacterium sp.]
MSDCIKFSEYFWEWMNHLAGPTRPNGFSRPVPEAQEGLIFSIDGGEIAYYLDSLPDGWIRLSESDRGSAPRFLFDFTSMDGAEAYLCVQYGNMVREKLGVSRDIREEHLNPRSRVGQESGRFESHITPWQGPQVYREHFEMEVFSQGGRDFFRASCPAGGVRPSDGDWDDAVALTWYADKSLVEVLASLRHPTGARLFELLGDRRM